MPPPHDGNEYIPFEKLVQVKQLDDNTFQSIALPFTPSGKDGAPGVAFGGHVHMQAAWAACQTVAKGFLISNVSGNFILAGAPEVPFTYSVQRIRDGRSYSTRIVTVTQNAGIMFTSTVIFKKAETGPLDVQSSTKLWEKYAAALYGKTPSDFEECPGFDMPWYWREQAKTGKNDAFPGLDSRKADMTAYNRGLHPLDKRQLIFYRSIGTMSKDDPNMHLCAQLYASDRNSLFHVGNAYGIGDLYTGLGSLVHQVIFHSGAEELMFAEDVGPEEAKWFCKEDWTTRYTNGRGLFVSRVWNPEGRHVATITQDGLIRLPRDADAQAKEIEREWGSIPQEETEVVRRRKGRL
ncbi:unnamed protein product [Zymoseptoria tritici ST99CH_3D7]|uniref:Uncharacterized protein n=1 Tax=Zymoseptoria tritici (strain ST99CH_3D7) TaxID=1276538 RepID=A0A1X7RKB6_ZYMT9|nr:unnamed protein product [Zymoseptoria tritici ST99CH_3D7]